MKFIAFIATVSRCWRCPCLQFLSLPFKSKYLFIINITHVRPKLFLANSNCKANLAKIEEAIANWRCWPLKMP